jgi:hypothetical protein
MKRALLLVLLALSATACSSRPAIRPEPPSAFDTYDFCREVFPQRAWTMVHTIASAWPGGRRGIMMGVVSLAPAENAVDCALLSIEGLRLFEARHDGTLTVRRALPPFDRPALAEGMMDDIRLLFFPPGGSPQETGRLPGGAPVCRYRLADGTEDIVQAPSGEIVIARYDNRGRPTRRATITRCRPAGAADVEPVACRIRLEAFRPADYRLDLDLVEARPVLDKPKDGS